MIQDDTTSILAHNVAEGDDESIGVLSDRLQDLGHPAGELLQRIYRGEGVPGDPTGQGSVGSMHGLQYTDKHGSLVPSYYPVLPPHVGNSGLGELGKGRIRVGYYSLPTGNWWHVAAGDASQPIEKRSWLVPATPGELEDHISRLPDEWMKTRFQNLGTRHTEDHYETRLRNAGIHPEQLATHVNTSPHQLSRVSRRQLQVRRYSATEGDVNNLLHQIASNPEHRQPGSVLRGVAADALQEQGREREADVLRNHPHGVQVHAGSVFREYPLPQECRDTAIEWHGGQGTGLYEIGSSGRANGYSARRALGEMNDFEGDYGNSDDLNLPSNRRNWDALYYHLSRIERETADEGHNDEEPDDEYEPPGTPTGGPGSPGGMYYSRRRYAAYRAPAGGMVVRGTHYVGGEMVPNMEGKFANPPAKARVVKPKPATQPLKLAEGEPIVLPQSDPKRRAVWRNRVRKLVAGLTPSLTTGKVSVSRQSRRVVMSKVVKYAKILSPLHQRLHELRPKLAEAVQKVYDEWDASDPEHGDCNVGFGGICQDISDAMSGVLGQHGIDTTELTPSSGDQHVWTGAYNDNEFYHVDIHPHHYETGGGYNWKKKPGVMFTPDHIDISPGDRSDHIDEDGNPHDY